jgi:Rrf2 family protein
MRLRSISQSGKLSRVLTKKSKYGLKAVLYLAGQAGRGPIPVAEVAEHERIPKKFLEAILLDLKRQGLLHSKKGKGGGYSLMRTPAEITIGQVIRTLDGPLALIPCVSQTAYARCEECVDEETCGVRRAMKEVRDATARILDHTTLSGLNAKVGAARRGGDVPPPAPPRVRQKRAKNARIRSTR